MPSLLVKVRYFLRFSEHADSQLEYIDLDTEEVVGIDYIVKSKGECVEITEEEAKGHKWYPRLYSKYGRMLNYLQVYVCVVIK